LVLTRHSLPILNEQWTRVINLSMFFLLCYDLTTIWGHEPCIGFFLWQFNMPDTLICYPGSIEKLKLLGATYYLLTYPNCQIRLFGYLVIWVCGNKVKNWMVSP
jgi:hypothetical protein